MLNIFFVILGLILGSFINVLVLRLHQEKSLLGRSRCPHCARQLSWWENIPVLSFISLRGRCRDCQKNISWQYPLVEIASAVLWWLAYYYFKNNIDAVLINGLYFSILLSLFIFDLKWYLLPDAITIPAIVLTFIFNLYLGLQFWPMVIVGLLGATWFAIQFFVSKGKWVGSGDIFLGALIGLMVGTWPMLLIVILISYISGSIVSLALVALGKKQWSGQIPFGVFLTLATVMVLIWGQSIWSWYFRLLW